MKTALLMTFLAMALVGCDRVVGHLATEVAKQSPTLVIGPGYKVQIDGAPTAVFGYDACPKDDPTMAAFFGPSPNDGEKTCIVVDKGRESVRVRYGTVAGLQDESWKIVQGEVVKYGVKFPTTTLQRPDGSFVISAENS